MPFPRKLPFWRSFRVLATVLMISSTPLGNAALPDLIYTFEETGDQGELRNLSMAGIAIPPSSGASVSFDAAKFGKGSLLVGDGGEGKSGWNAILNTPALQCFKEGTQRFTVAAWIKFSQLESFTLFWRIGGGTSEQGFFQFSYLGGDARRLYFAVVGEDESGLASAHRVSSSRPAKIDPDTWHHLAMTFDEGVIRFYLDGNALGETRHLPVSKVPPISKTTASIRGCWGTKSSTRVDDFLFLGDRALTDNEVQQLFSEGAAGLSLQ